MLIYSSGDLAVRVLQCSRESSSKGRFTGIDVRTALELAAKLKIHVVQGWNNTTFHEALVMMHRYSLTSYDASYQALAIEKNMPLATTDNELRAAATMAAVPLVL